MSEKSGFGSKKVSQTHNAGFNIKLTGPMTVPNQNNIGMFGPGSG